MLPIVNYSDILSEYTDDGDRHDALEILEELLDLYGLNIWKIQGNTSGHMDDVWYLQVCNENENLLDKLPNEITPNDYFIINVKRSSFEERQLTPRIKEVDIPLILPFKESVYYLKSFISHVIKNKESGQRNHYTAHVNCKGKWYELNDRRKTVVNDIENVVKQADILLYEKRLIGTVFKRGGRIRRL